MVAVYGWRWLHFILFRSGFQKNQQFFYFVGIIPGLMLIENFLHASSPVVGTSTSELFREAQQRMIALRTYAPSGHYRWHLCWKQKKRVTFGTLTGTVEGDHHWVTITFASGEEFSFDKNNPEWVLYPNRLCLYPRERWGEPLNVNRALNAYLLTMSFLTWELQTCVKTAKFGRKVLRADVQRDKQTARLFLDKNFNTLLKAEWQNIETNHCGNFTLKTLKKFPQGWGLREATYELNGIQTDLRVLSVEHW
jgi:hypothetical protein